MAGLCGTLSGHYLRARREMWPSGKLWQELFSKALRKQQLLSAHPTCQPHARPGSSLPTNQANTVSSKQAFDNASHHQNTLGFAGRCLRLAGLHVALGQSSAKATVRSACRTAVAEVPAFAVDVNREHLIVDDCMWLVQPRVSRTPDVFFSKRPA